MCRWTYSKHAINNLKRQEHATNAEIIMLNTSAENNKCIITKKTKPAKNF